MQDPPWLTNQHWRRRELRYYHGVGIAVLLLGGVVAGIALSGLVALLLRMPQPHDAEGWMYWLGAWLVVVPVAVPLWMLIRRFLERLYFGASVCHLRTLPGVIGGWFKADIDCRLPGVPDGRVEVRLVNCVLGRYGGRDVFWEMGQTMDAAPVQGWRSVLAVHMQVPRDAKQRCRLPIGRHGALAAAGDDVWVLEIWARGERMNYRAEFHVPLFDTADAPEPEQRPN